MITVNSPMGRIADRETEEGWLLEREAWRVLAMVVEGYGSRGYLTPTVIADAEKAVARRRELDKRRIAPSFGERRGGG